MKIHGRMLAGATACAVFYWKEFYHTLKLFRQHFNLETIKQHYHRCLVDVQHCSMVLFFGYIVFSEGYRKSIKYIHYYVENVIHESIQFSPVASFGTNLFMLCFVFCWLLFSSFISTWNREDWNFNLLIWYVTQLRYII